MIPPRKPFPEYKWRWATLTPTEGLNEPPVFLGVLRVLRENQGGLPNSADVTAGLARVEREVEGRVNTTVRLVRDDERNLLRNSGQYWKALGLLIETRGIELTPFGIMVADGRITRDEFAASVVKTLELPNRWIQTAEEVARWAAAGVRTRPLQLILDVIRALGNRAGMSAAYMTPDELIRVAIPLAGNNSQLNEYVESILGYRQGRLDLREWPDCAPEANDRRMAREFLLFLDHYGLCSRNAGADNYSDRFVIEMAETADLEALTALPILEGADPVEVAEQVRTTGSSIFVERQRVSRPVLERPQQGRFRRRVLDAYRTACLLTGERIPEVLEAAHIIPVEYRGRDEAENGICFRSDIHALYDTGHIRIRPTGEVVCSDIVTQSASYRGLPRRLQLPNFVSIECVEWRWNYQ